MPELPDIAVLKIYLDATSLHKEIEDVEVKHVKILQDISSRSLVRELKGKRFERSLRHGKYLFVELNQGPWVSLHFGMTGSLEYHKRNRDAPQYTRVAFVFSQNYELAYISKRLLGAVSLSDSPEEFIERHGLGPDALDLDLQRFKRLLDGRRGGIKSALMNQELMAGIGNVYSDEILFQAGVMPVAKVQALDEERIETLYDSMQTVLTTAIEHKANPSQFPETFLTPQRTEAARCPRCGGPIRKKQVSQRAAYFCPHCQQG